MTHRACIAWLLGAALLNSGCGKTSKTPGSPTDSATAGSPAAGGTSPDGVTPPPPPANCDAPQPGPAPLSGLDGFELGRSMVDALREAPALVDSSKLLASGLRSNEGDVTLQFLQVVHEVAHEAAQKLSQDPKLLRKLSGCDDTSAKTDDCRDNFLQRFLTRAYRRPLLDEDRSEMTAVFESGVKLGGSFASGVRAVVEVALQGPDFMYLLELGQDGATDGAVRPLTGYEAAARLAYFITAAPADDELLAAAAAGPLTPDTIEAQARRLLGSPQSREALRHTYAVRFPIDAPSPDAELGYPETIATLAREESSRFVEDVTFDGSGTFRALLTEPTTWVNERLAGFYGYPNVTGDAFQKIQLDASQRGGLFTQSAFLRSSSFGPNGDAVQRGLTVLRQLLCYDQPPPPANVPIPPPSESATDTTLRATLEQATAQSTCQTCHRDINPVGFAFGHYDGFGRWLDRDHGQPIDTTGELYRTDAQGPFRDALDLMSHIADSHDAQNCFVTGWLRTAYRRDSDPADACAIQAASSTFAETDGKVLDLIVALAKTDNFRYRLASELKP